MASPLPPLNEKEKSVKATALQCESIPASDPTPQELPIEEVDERVEKFAYPEERKKRFVDAYFAAEMSSIRAAKLLGYGAQWGKDQLASKEIKHALSQRLQELQDASHEVIETLHAQMRGDIGDFFNEHNQFDLQAAKRKGLTRLVKRLKIRDITAKGADGEIVFGKEYDIELYNAQSAAVTLSELYGLKQKARENDNDIERKRMMYESLIDTITNEMIRMTGKTPDRDVVIQRIALVDPEIHSYILV